jgi:hypothetical protein
MALKSSCLISVIFLISFTSPATAQQFGVSWKDNSKISYDYDAMLPLKNGNYLLLKFEEMKSFRIYSEIPLEPNLILVNSDLVTIKETKLQLYEKNSVFEGLERYGDNVFFIYNSYDKSSKTTTVYAIKVNEQTLSQVSKTIIGSFDSESRYNQSDVSYKVSADSSKILLFVEEPERKKENKQFYLGVYDQNFKKIWSKNVELPIGDRFVSVYDKDISNEGKVYLAIKHYDKEVSRQTVMENGDKIPSYTYKLIVIGRNIPNKEISFDLKNHFIQGTKLVYGKNGIITVAGFYKKKSNGNISGVFHSVFDTSSFQVSSPIMIGFPEDLLVRIDKDGFGKAGGADPGLDPDFRVNQIISRDNGSVDLVSEYLDYYLSENTLATAPGQPQISGAAMKSYSAKYVYGDVVNINLDKTGKAVFTRLPKHQEGYRSNLGLGYYPIIYNDKLVIFYNDDADNIDRDLSKAPEHIAKFKKGIFAAAIIDAKGNLSRQSIYSYKDDNYITLPASISRISATKYFLTSIRAAGFKIRNRFGILEIK